MSLCLECPAGRMEADEVVAAILGLGSPAYTVGPTGMCSTYLVKLGHIFIRNLDHRACIV